ncbi:MAG: hypothetical protein CM1200mP10_30040 [Candidatus Neomarinimicrobiota bacterium]|nr:MAG: hypothetical protein CM1200mP10_30040 [Candidatus Neomarinimicrobiota bacterium]
MRCGRLLRDIKHPISVARKVMEQTDHVMLVGNGAKKFALAKGFKEENLLTKNLVKNGYVGKKIIVLKIHGGQMKNMIQLVP